VTPDETAEGAALLATRDRYEAALREIASADIVECITSDLIRVAEEALAAAPEDTNG
jgi:hypothetical protein